MIEANDDSSESSNDENDININKRSHSQMQLLSSNDYSSNGNILIQNTNQNNNSSHEISNRENNKNNTNDEEDNKSQSKDSNDISPPSLNNNYFNNSYNNFPLQPSIQSMNLMQSNHNIPVSSYPQHMAYLHMQNMNNNMNPINTLPPLHVAQMHHLQQQYHLQSLGHHQNQSIQQQMMSQHSIPPSHINNNMLPLGPLHHMGIQHHMSLPHHLSHMGHLQHVPMMMMGATGQHHPINQHQLRQQHNQTISNQQMINNSIQSNGMPTNIVTMTSSHPIKKPKRELPEWLHVVGDACHSDKQIQSGQDLTKIKKKYKLIRCNFCAEFNNNAPWSTLKSRKFEAENFLDHERSTHHIKAVLRRSNALGEPAPPHLQQLANFQQLNQSALTNDLKKAINSNINSTISGLNGSINGLGGSSVISGAMPMPSMNPDNDNNDKDRYARNLTNNSIINYNPNMLNHPFNQTVRNNAITNRFIQPQTLQQLGINENMKSKIAPNWLKTEGKLCHSEKQLASGRDLNGAKKKYKRTMCTYCAEFNPASPWAVMKTRKYESAVLNEHDRSHHHRKAMNARELALGPLNFDGMSAYHPSPNSFNEMSISGLGNGLNLGSFAVGSMLNVNNMNGLMNSHAINNLSQMGIFNPNYAMGGGIINGMGNVMNNSINQQQAQHQLHQQLQHLQQQQLNHQNNNKANSNNTSNDISNDNKSDD
eukprot:CAMPEP_0196766686 /NCGR_PEP_ID=MMETSP1095-20130614/28605_1 /TAXON_ID=96789 ORGANISM="Chromulina nebulosa, Strain UTEXLB2642" /NCGR_SAMPLE_ID=MMETSP1095 /ASSEMBLY_ACC=CAM_ASM_000446 /LENGTH=705 /DNA_ID=CAMNT_0042130103 /DNA_START=89 /DNA_END=2206 /DNA_ORIENTATION=-